MCRHCSVQSTNCRYISPLYTLTQEGRKKLRSRTTGKKKWQHAHLPITYLYMIAVTFKKSVKSMQGKCLESVKIWSRRVHLSSPQKSDIMKPDNNDPL